MNLSKQLINGFIQTELELFKKDFDESPVPEIQDIRSLSIAWVCYYFKEVISNKNIESIRDFVDTVYLMANYNTHGWFRISALQATAFILTSDIDYANNLIKDICCGQGWARGYIIKSTAIICPLLSFQNAYLKKATEYNLMHLQAYDEENAIMYLLTSGTPDEKKEWIKTQLIEDIKENHKKFYSELTKRYNKYHTGFFVNTFNQAKSYFIFKIMCETNIIEIETTLFDDIELNFLDLYKKEKAHPLNKHYIDMCFLSDENI